MIRTNLIRWVTLLLSPLSFICIHLCNSLGFYLHPPTYARTHTRRYDDQKWSGCETFSPNFSLMLATSWKVLFLSAAISSEFLRDTGKRIWTKEASIKSWLRVKFQSYKHLNVTWDNASVCFLTTFAVTWYSTSIVPFLSAVWKKHSVLPAGRRNVNSLSRFGPKQLTKPKHQPNKNTTSHRPAFLRISSILMDNVRQRAICVQPSSRPSSAPQLYDDLIG